LSLAATAVGAVLLFPLTAQLLAAGGDAGGAVGVADFGALLRLSPGPAPGSWLPALFLPVAGLLAFGVAGDAERSWAWRALGTGAVAIPLAWAGASGYLPAFARDPIPYLAAAAFALSALVALAVRSLAPGMRRTAFGPRQLTLAGVIAVMTAGLILQSFQAMGGGWAVGEDRVPAAWPVVATAEPDTPFRVLWLGRADGRPFPPPGGAPDGVVSAGPVSVSYGITGRDGRSVLGIALPTGGPGDDRLRGALAELLSGIIRHGGALLAPLGIRYVVAGEGALPGAGAARLDDQVDLDLTQRAGGLLIYRNAEGLPEAASIPGEDAVAAARSADPLVLAGLDATPRALGRAGAATFRGPVAADEPSVVEVATPFDPRWRILTEPPAEVVPFAAFGWSVGFEVPAGTTAVEVSHGGGNGRILILVGLGVLWAAALWLVRRRAPEEVPPPGRRAAAEADGETPVVPTGAGRADSRRAVRGRAP
jgi:hypothetical protein